MSQFLLPDLGEGLEEAQLVAWLVAVGETVRLNQPLCQVETAKALVDIPSPYAGTVTALHAEPGTLVPVGAALITIETSDAPTTQPAASSGEEASGPVLVGYGPNGATQTFARRRRGALAADAAPGAPMAAANGATSAGVATPAPDALPSASPLVRKMAQERGIDLRSLTGSGPGGRIRVEDLEAATRNGSVAAAQAAPPPPLHADDEPDEQRISTVGLRKAIAAKMVRAATTIPHLIEYGLFNASALTELRDRLRADPAYAGQKLTFLPFFVAALVAAVREYPIMNSRWDEEGNAIVIRRSIHVGIATDTARGLLVPVIHDAQRLSLAQVAAEAERLIARARAGTLDAPAMTGGSITLTNVGASGPVETGAPIINAPEVCILGIGAIKPRPTVVGNDLLVRPGAWLSIACDHRVVDGATAAQFLGALVRLLEAPESLAR